GDDLAWLSSLHPSTSAALASPLLPVLPLSASHPVAASPGLSREWAKGGQLVRKSGGERRDVSPPVVHPPGAFTSRRSPGICPRRHHFADRPEKVPHRQRCRRRNCFPRLRFGLPASHRLLGRRKEGPNFPGEANGNSSNPNEDIGGIICL